MHAHTQKTFIKLRDERIFLKVVNGGKTVQACAKEEGIHRNTVRNAIKRVLSDPEIQEFILRSKDNLVRLLPLCDQVVEEILSYRDPKYFAVQLRLVESIYRTFGILKS